MDEPYVPKDRVKCRFSSHRFRKVVDSLSADQRQFVIDNGFGNLLNISDFTVPIPLLEWLMDHLIVGVAEFKFSKFMVQQILGIPSGPVSVDLDTVPDGMSDEIAKLRASYIVGVGEKATINEAICQTIEDHNENSFMRSFMLVALSTVICPSTQNYVNLRYLNCLMNCGDIRNYDWAGHVTKYLLTEVTIDSIENEYADNSRFYGSCLPILAIAYMDFLDLENDFVNANNISYDVPRICNVKSSDFNFVMEVDCNRKNRDKRPSFGVLSPPVIQPPAAVEDEVPGGHADGAPNLAQPDQVAVGNLQEPAQVPGGLDVPADLTEIHQGNGGNVVPYFSGQGVVQSDYLGNSFSQPDIVQVSEVADIVSKHCSLLMKEASQFFNQKSLDSSNQLGSVFGKHLSMLSSEIYEFALSRRSTSVDSISGATISSFQVHIDEESNEQFGNSLSTAKNSNITNLQGQQQLDDFALRTNAVHIDSTHMDCQAEETRGSEIGLSPPPACNIGGHTIDTGDVALSPVPACNLVNNVSPGISIAIGFAEQSPENFEKPTAEVTAKPLDGSSTIDKKKRKRRAAIVLDDENSLKLKKIPDEIEDLYLKYVRIQFIKPQDYNESPDFVIINGFHSNYERFRDSLKPRGHVFDDVMGLFVQLFNEENKGANNPKSSVARSKVAFSPFLAGKLIGSTKSFVPESTEAELTRINAAFNIKEADLLMFPICLGDHWVLIVINYLSNEINFLDSMGSLSVSQRERFITNLVTNFQKSCEIAKIFKRNLLQYTRTYPVVPKQTNTGIYVMLFAENFNGKEVKNFDKRIADQYRKIIAHKLITSPLNEIDVKQFGRLQ
ncbi:hypothetical protein ACP70R_015516 [Stipagrostis hirtigluma subsp. patula]